jgi:hypothetical protein
MDGSKICHEGAHYGAPAGASSRRDAFYLARRARTRLKRFAMPNPFRWTIAKREQLGTLAEALTSPAPQFLAELRATAARVLAFADGADLAFVGRTPENFYD